MSDKLRVTQIKSAIGYNKKIRATLTGLGITKLHQTVELKNSPAVTGMIGKVRHLVFLEEV